MIVEYDRVYENIRRGPIGVDNKHYVWQATAGLVAVAAEQAAFAIQAPHLSYSLAIAFAETVNTYTELVLPYYGVDYTFKETLIDPIRSQKLKGIITNTAGELSRMNMQRIAAAAQLKLTEDPSRIIKNAPLSVLHEELMAIHPSAPKDLPNEQLLLESLQKKVSHPDAQSYREKIANVVAQSVNHSSSGKHFDTHQVNTVKLGNRQAALLWQTRLLLKAASKKVDGTFDNSLLSDWQFAPYNTMVARAYTEGYKPNNNSLEGVSYALITMLQDHAECISESEWLKQQF